jgi:uncharacterized protein (DUF433 family)
MATPTEVDIGTLIVSTPGVVGGSPRIAGTRISVKHIAECYNDGMTAAEMMERFSTIDLIGAYAGIAYYLANKAKKIDQDIADEDAFIEEFLRDPANRAHRLSRDE